MKNNMLIRFKENNLLITEDHMKQRLGQVAVAVSVRLKPWRPRHGLFSLRFFMMFLIRIVPLIRSRLLLSYPYQFIMYFHPIILH
jgi:hypothetical protein